MVRGASASTASSAPTGPSSTSSTSSATGGSTWTAPRPKASGRSTRSWPPRGRPTLAPAGVAAAVGAEVAEGEAEEAAAVAIGEVEAVAIGEAAAAAAEAGAAEGQATLRPLHIQVDKPEHVLVKPSKGGYNDKTFLPAHVCQHDMSDIESQINTLSSSVQKVFACALMRIRRGTSNQVLEDLPRQSTMNGSS